MYISYIHTHAYMLVLTHLSSHSTTWTWCWPRSQTTILLSSRASSNFKRYYACTQSSCDRQLCACKRPSLVYKQGGVHPTQGLYALELHVCPDFCDLTFYWLMMSVACRRNTTITAQRRIPPLDCSPPIGVLSGTWMMYVYTYMYAYVYVYVNVSVEKCASVCMYMHVYQSVCIYHT